MSRLSARSVAFEIRCDGEGRGAIAFTTARIDEPAPGKGGWLVLLMHVKHYCPRTRKKRFLTADMSALVQLAALLGQAPGALVHVPPARLSVC